LYSLNRIHMPMCSLRDIGDHFPQSKNDRKQLYGGIVVNNSPLVLVWMISNYISSCRIYFKFLICLPEQLCNNEQNYFAEFCSVFKICIEH